MLRVDILKSAADAILAASLTGGDWTEPLSRFAAAAGAQGVVLVRSDNGRFIEALASPEVREPVQAFADGKAPPSSRQGRVPSVAGTGFRLDQTDYAEEELAIDPYYQEFLRSYGLFWHANITLLTEGPAAIDLSLKRALADGPYQRDDARRLNGVARDLETAVALARAVLRAEARGASTSLGERSFDLFELNARGEVIGGERADAAPLSVRNHRLSSASAKEQEAIDRAVAVALGPDRSIGMAVVSGVAGRRYFLRVMPVPGIARDVFLAASAVAALTPADAVDSDGRRRMLLRRTFELTGREAQLASLVGDGVSLADIAERMAIRLGTARTHLKDVFSKTGTNRQAQLAALIARIPHEV